MVRVVENRGKSFFVVIYNENVVLKFVLLKTVGDFYMKLIYSQKKLRRLALFEK